MEEMVVELAKLPPSSLLKVHCIVNGVSAPSYINTEEHGWVCYLGSITTWSVKGPDRGVSTESGAISHNTEDVLARAAFAKLAKHPYPKPVCKDQPPGHHPH